jgi:SAM-dependent methyltransferase
MGKFQLTRLHNWLIFSVINPALRTACEKYAKGKLADIGCGEKPYREMLSNLVSSHLGIDHAETLHEKGSIDIFGTIYNIPVIDGEFDTVLCTDVLEHVEEPSDALREANRILKPGGYAIYTVPLFWHLHEEPRDFYRYTKHGLRYLFERNGFEIVELISLSGFVVTFAQELCYFLMRIPGKRSWNPLFWVVGLLVTVIQSTAYVLRYIDKSNEFTIEYLIVGEKKR